ncbi:MAG TPA: zf-TFIIB domain-containing protein [Chthoniobacterales bacterium]|nr:zf-TFIIB domain-containing protein [Chthoniobacterales bacterium]
MVCPACENNLTQLVAAGVVLDVCSGGCGGIWFDSFELQKVEAAQEITGDVEISIPRDLARKVDYQKRRICPTCVGVVLMRHFYSKLRRVVVDECPSCGGFWLDAGELENIRAERESLVAEEKAKAIVTRLDVKYTAGSQVQR